MTDSIAIVGMACRFPDANSPGELWENVLAQRQSFRRMPPERLRLEDYLTSQRSTPDSTYSSEAAVLEGFEFDRQRYRVAGELYRTVDPAHWLALDVATQALADAGYTDGEQLPHETTGVVVGNTLTGDFSRATVMRLRWPFVRRVVESELTKDGWPVERRQAFLDRLATSYKEPFPPVGEETLAGSLSNTIAGRICNYYNFGGGGYSVDGACASSLIAVSTACSLLITGDIDVALAGGVDLSLDPFELVGFAKVGALASDKMRVYDERSDGFLPGEGCGFVVLTRHRDAVAKGRRIYAVIRGWGISSDGHGGMTRPEVDGQSLAIERAYRRAGFSPKTVNYFEGHGTGTSVGDLTELTALSGILRKRRGGSTRTVASIGSVKANIGHTKAAAGVAGLIKTAMAVHARLLPPTSGCERPHSALKSESPVLRAMSDGEVWPADGHLRAGVNGLGFGGINAHVVLEGCGTPRRTDLTSREKMLLASVQDAEVFFLSGDDHESVLQQIEHLLTFAAKVSRAELGDLSATLQAHLRPSRVRAALVAATPAQLVSRLKHLLVCLRDKETKHLDTEKGVFFGVVETAPRIGFLFPGQGVPAHLNGGLFKRRFDFVRELYPTEVNSSDVVSTKVAQPAILRATLAGLRAMKALGIEAKVGVGHSLGELAALCWAGALTEEQLLRIGEARGSAMMEVSEPIGTMANIGTNQQKLQHLLNGDQIVIAAMNAPQNTVVAGESGAVASFVERVQKQGITTNMIPVSHAFHSPLMEGSVIKIAQHLKDESFGDLRRAVVSTVTGNLLERNQDLRQLLIRQITAPVLFMQAVQRAASDVDLLIEIGPGHVLGGLVKGFIETPVISVDAGSESLSGLLSALAAAFALGGDINHGAIFQNRFTRPFSLSWQPRFLTSPCELAPVSQVSETSLDQRAVEIDGRSPFEETLGLELQGQPSTPGLDDPLELFRQLVAERLELSPTDVRDEDRLLGDLHLNSLAVTQLVTEIAKRLGMPAPASPTDYSTFTVGAVGRAFDELHSTRGTNLGANELPPGVDTWIRTFAVDLVEKPIAEPQVERQRGRWQVISAADCKLKNSLRRALDAAAIGDGVCVILPANDEESRAKLLLDAAQAFLAATKPGKFVLVHHGGSGAAFVRSLFAESPDDTVVVVGVPASHPRSNEWIVAEMRSAKGYVEVQYDESGRRREPVLRLAPQSVEPSGLTLDENDVLLVTGGGKGIAAECAMSLAERTGVRLVLLGRSDPLDDKDLAHNLARMTAKNIRYHYESVDVSQADQVSATVRKAESEFGPITAVMHGAGANRPQLITELDETAIARTMAPKVDGVRNVLAVVDPSKLRLFITFGSVIARTGMAGEADYALANEALRQLTEDWKQRHPHCECLALEWSIWSGVGMGERLGRVDALLRQGITPISPDEGLRVLNELVFTKQSSVAVVIAGRLGELPTLPSLEVGLPFRRFLEKKIAHVAGVELIVEAELSTDSDPYLKNHTFQGESLFPSVMGLEAMAQVSMALMETEELPVFENVKFNRAIAVSDGSPTLIRIAALKRSSDQVDLVIRCDSSGFNAEHFSATCRFGNTAEVKPRKLSATSIASDGMCAELVPDRDMYGEILFQTGRFQRLMGYRSLCARECVAEIRSTKTSDWFSPYLPSELALGDPASRDAALHGIQACIPHQTILPVEVERIVFPSTARETATLFVRARERSHVGNRFIYDVEIASPDGTVLEYWHGLHLMQVDAIPLTDHAWVEPLLGTYVERRLDELLQGAGISVVFERSANGNGRASSDRAIKKCAQTAEVYRRTDGRPVVVGELAVSASHAADLTMAIAGPGSVGCDIEKVSAQPASAWRDLLGAQPYELARLIAAEGGEDESLAATRVWTARESLKKAGANALASGVLLSIADDGWVQLQAGRFRIATFIAKTGALQEQLALAVCVEDTNGTHPKKSRSANL